MELFFSDRIGADSLVLTPEDSLHCARVLRHRVGDEICVIDGEGTMYECTVLSDNPKQLSAGIVNRHPQWHAHPYRLAMGVCPTKNNDRFEWFVEKAVEVGVDSIYPLEGDRSERRVYKGERARKIALSAAKQSLKASLPEIGEMVPVRDFVGAGRNGLKLIAYCFDDERVPRLALSEVVSEYLSSHRENPEITVLIGPEGDFSPSEAEYALQNGYVPVHLGPSRLRTETAALVAVTQIYTALV